MLGLVKVIVPFVVLGLSSLASADISGPAWVCQLRDTQMSGFTAAVGVSVSKVTGDGVVHCHSMIGRDEIETPVHVSLIGLGAGLGYASISKMEVSVASVGVSTPNDLFGTYKIQGEVAAVVGDHGGNLHTFAAVNRSGLSIGIGVTDYQPRGLDLSAELQELEIRPTSTY